MWLEWIKSNNPGIIIQHALTDRGEYRVPGTNYRVDGYCEQTRTVYEFLGCLWHGCPLCHPDRQRSLPKTNETADLLYNKTMDRIRHLESLHYKVVTIWEHEFSNLDLGEMDFDIQTRLNLRDSFFGGRTNATKLYYEAGEEEQIRYVDFTSLYPYVNKYARYPMGHPEIITRDFKNITEYFGVAKVKILPPRGLYHPVLPYRSGDKLTFPLCRTCTTAQSQKQCTCHDDARALIGTWCTPEIVKALECGYEILKTYEVYHWEESSQYDPTTCTGGLFAAFVNTFLKVKQEASGWPLWCITDQDKLNYIEDYHTKEGVRLDPRKICKNPGRRALAKLLLNSFWGKFAQRSNLSQFEYAHTQAEFFRLMLDKAKIVTDFHIVNEDTITIEYKYTDDEVPDSPNGNIVIASFTTAWARLHLLEVLHTVGRNCLYYDTDSVIYADDGLMDVRLGDYLGQLTNELPNDQYITQFVSGGPKNYSYVTNKGETVCKVRGFTLNHKNAMDINFKTMKDIVTGPPGQKIILKPEKTIVRDKKKSHLYNVERKKDYRMVYTKRWILPDLDTLPYGY